MMNMGAIVATQLMLRQQQRQRYERLKEQTDGKKHGKKRDRIEANPNWLEALREQGAGEED